MHWEPETCSERVNRVSFDYLLVFRHIFLDYIFLHVIFSNTMVIRLSLFSLKTFIISLSIKETKAKRLGLSKSCCEASPEVIFKLDWNVMSFEFNRFWIGQDRVSALSCCRQQLFRNVRGQKIIYNKRLERWWPDFECITVRDNISGI